MKCFYCLTEFFPEFAERNLVFAKQPSAYPSPDPAKRVWGYFNATTATCPNCFGAHIALEVKNQHGAILRGAHWIFPSAGAYPPPPPQVPPGIAADYREANGVLPVSAKASAALSRRCLQAILTGAGYTDRNLADQVQKAIDETAASRALPASLRDSLDAIRNFGNFSAHPITDKTTLQIIDVEDGEAEWCLELLADMFDHYYVRPALAAERRTALSEKLMAAGKPPMKIGQQDQGNSDETAETGDLIEDQPAAEEIGR